MTVHAPGTAEDLEALIKWAAAEAKPLKVVGNGTKDGWGHDVAAAEAVTTRDLTGVVLYEPDELVLSARPGTPLPEIVETLTANNQQMAFEPPSLTKLYGVNAAPTLGGVIAANLAGPRRPFAGAARDHVLGVAGVSGRGEAFKAGGRVVKNVTGYDLPKLMSGSFGTLAVMSGLTIKVLPRPETVAAILVEGLDPERGGALLRQVSGGQGIEATGLAYLPTAAAAGVGLTVAGPGAAAIRLEGVAPSVAARREMVTALLPAGAGASVLADAPARAVWGQIAEAADLLNAPADWCVWRLSVPPTAGPSLGAKLADRTGGTWFADWVGGLIWLATPQVSADAVRGALVGLDGHATLVRAPAAVRAEVAVFQPVPGPLAALNRRVKEGFDPRGVLNPGRMGA